MSSKKAPLRLGVLLSGGGTTLENFFLEIEAGRLNAEVRVVIASNNGAYGLERARQRQVATRVVRRQDFTDNQAFSEALTEHLVAAEVELVCLAGFLRLYRIPDRFEGRVMNIHPALIPKYCGKGFYGHHVHEAVVAAGETESGCTVHFADNHYDHGPIILQRKVPVYPEDSPDEVAARVFKEECIAYPEAIKRFAEGRYLKVQ